MAKDKNSTLASYAEVFLDISITKEACPLNAAPTSSTTLTMALGDALAVCLMKNQDFQKEDFASFHPGGSLGKQLFIKVDDLLKKDNLTKKCIGGYFPVNYEIDDLEILKKLKKKKYQISLPVIKKNLDMDYYSWSFDDPLKINQYGIPEPFSKKLIYPDILLVPLVAFDKNLNRLGYGGGYYDRVIDKLSKKKYIIKIGLALSVQKINNVPVTKYDKKLDYIVTDKYIL